MWVVRIRIPSLSCFCRDAPCQGRQKEHSAPNPTMVLPDLPQMGGGGVLLCLWWRKYLPMKILWDIAHHAALIILLLTCKVYVRTVTKVRLAGAVLHYK